MGGGVGRAWGRQGATRGLSRLATVSKGKPTTPPGEGVVAKQGWQRSTPRPVWHGKGNAGKYPWAVLTTERGWRGVDVSRVSRRLADHECRHGRMVRHGKRFVDKTSTNTRCEDDADVTQTEQVLGCNAHRHAVVRRAGHTLHRHHEPARSWSPCMQCCVHADCVAQPAAISLGPVGRFSRCFTMWRVLSKFSRL